MTDHNPLPRCPYCGGAMEIDTFENYLGWCGQAVCKACKSRAALKRYYNLQEEAQQAAYAAAMQRYVETNHPLTLEEVKEQRAVWLEENLCEPVPVIFYVDAFPHQSVFVGVFGVGEDEYFDNNVWYDNEDYGVEWRCWLRKPTVEERAAAPWGEQAP